MTMKGSSKGRSGSVNGTVSNFPAFFVLTPLPGTPLFQRMESEGRLLHKDWSKYNGATVVFKPKLMTEETLQRGFNWLCKEGYSWGSIAKRVFHPQQRFFTRVLSNIAYRNIVRGTPEASYAGPVKDLAEDE